MLFGGINGLNAFFPENIIHNSHVPPVVITAFRKLNENVEMERPISETRKLELSHKDYVFSFEFAALDFTAPMKNMYAYKMEGLDKDWIRTDALKRYAHYTTLPPGKYVFRVKGSNNDGVWNEEGTSIEIVITPPFWKSWWFRILTAIAALVLGYAWYKRRLKTVRMKIELETAHNAQMSIMPRNDPCVEGLDISGSCLPANEVGGDFYDYVWLNGERNKFGIAIGDVSGKAMKAAMIASMSSGMMFLKAGETSSVKEIITQLNASLYEKTDESMFTTFCLASIDTQTRELVYSIAGAHAPLLKTNGSVSQLSGTGRCLPLGTDRNSSYGETHVLLKKEDIIVMFTDGITEARNNAKEFYENGRLKHLLENTDTSVLSAEEIKERIIDDVMTFSGATQQDDDITVIVVKAT
jgi:hypothetical protein